MHSDIRGYKNWGNNVYSFAIPQVSGRFDKISIEFYYTDNEIQRMDQDGRRLYLAKHFLKIHSLIKQCF